LTSLHALLPGIAAVHRCSRDFAGALGVQAGPGADEGIDSLQCRFAGALYALLMAHPIDPARPLLSPSGFGDRAAPPALCGVRRGESLAAPVR
ncbi:MAG: hypothetical protein ACRDQ4_27450, partial [Pseudonocardiaceae bacterium]